MSIVKVDTSEIEQQYGYNDLTAVATYSSLPSFHVKLQGTITEFVIKKYFDETFIKEIPLDEGDIASDGTFLYYPATPVDTSLASLMGSGGQYQYSFKVDGQEYKSNFRFAFKGIVFPRNIIFSTVIVDDAGGGNGSITVNAQGGYPPLTYSKDGGSTYQSSNIFSGLTAGDYPIKVKDSKGFESYTTSVNVASDIPASWSTVLTGSSSVNIDPRSIDIDGSLMIICGFGDASIRSTDKGATFTEIAMPESNLSTSVEIINTNVYIVGSSGKLFKSVDSGLNYSTIQLTTSANNNCQNWFSSSVGLVGRSSTFTTNAIQKSIDSGATFSDVNIIGDGTDQVRINAIKFRDANNAIAVGGRIVAAIFKGAIFKTTDGGDNWVLVEDNLPSILNGLDVNASNKWVACGDNGLVYTSDNDFTNKTTLTTPNNPLFIAAQILDDNEIFLANGDNAEGKAIYQSDDLGSTWVQSIGINPDTSNQLPASDIKMISNTEGYAATFDITSDQRLGVYST